MEILEFSPENILHTVILPFLYQNKKKMFIVASSIPLGTFHKKEGPLEAKSSNKLLAFIITSQIIHDSCLFVL